jgi:hypothetical protein
LAAPALSALDDVFGAVRARDDLLKKCHNRGQRDECFGLREVFAGARRTVGKWRSEKETRLVRRAHLAVMMILALAVGVPDGGRAQAKPAERAPVVESDALTELLVKFQVTGTFESFDPVSNEATFTFSGPFFEATVGRGGLISDRPGQQLGDVVGARVQFTLGTSSDTFRFTCDQCEFRFFDGAVVRPLLDDPTTPQPETDIPMEGRMLVELGPVPGPDPALVNLRGAGCGGAKETTGRGKLAGMRGALCVNGVFGFPAPLSTLLDNPVALVGLRGVGESDCTLVFHRPLIPVP